MTRLVTIALLFGLGTSALAEKPATNPEFQGIKEHGPLAQTGFEDLNGDGSDAMGFQVGTAFFSGGVAGTRRFPPGYNKGMFAFITPGQLGVTSTITFNDSFNTVHFFAKDIRELTPDGRGVLIVKYKFLPVTETIPLSDRWQPYSFQMVESITIQSSGVSNLDTFTVVSF